jgi:hypothetical protein
MKVRERGGRFLLSESRGQSPTHAITVRFPDPTEGGTFLLIWTTVGFSRITPLRWVSSYCSTDSYASYWFRSEFMPTKCLRRSQWPRGLRHEMSSPAQKLRSWVRGMDVCPHFFCLPCPLWVAALKQGWSPFKESCWLSSSRLLLMGNRPEGLIRKK